MPPIPVAFLGVTHPHAAGRASMLGSIPAARLAGVFDDDPEAARDFAERFGTRAMDLEAVLDAARGGLVVIESRNRRCAELAQQAARRGVALLLEKPGAHNLETLRRVRDVVRSSGVFAQVGYHMRYAPSVGPAIEHVKAGKLGTITTGRFHASVQQPWLLNEWFTDPEDRGGLVFLDACHILDVLLVMLGTPDRVTARMRKLPSLGEHPFEDSAALILEFGDTLVAGDVCGWETNDWVDTWNVELYGTAGTLGVWVHPPRLRLWTPRDGPRGGWSIQSDEAFDGQRNYHFELCDVIERVREGRSPGGATLDHAVEILEVIEQAYRSAGELSR